jgi:toxin ParE1/3/4
VKVIWLSEAERNRESQIEYIAERNPWAAVDLGDAIKAALGRLADYPEIGRLGRVRGTFELVIARTPLIMVYRIDPTAIVILRVLHGAQRWPPLEH